MSDRQGRGQGAQTPGETNVRQTGAGPGGPDPRGDQCQTDRGGAREPTLQGSDVKQSMGTDPGIRGGGEHPVVVVVVIVPVLDC